LLYVTRFHPRSQWDHVLAEFRLSGILSEYPVHTHVHRKIHKRLSSSFRRDLINVLRARERIAMLFISYILRRNTRSQNVKQYRQLCARPKFRAASLFGLLLKAKPEDREARGSWTRWPWKRMKTHEGNSEFSRVVQFWGSEEGTRALRAREEGTNVRTEDGRTRSKEREKLVLSIVEKVCSWG